MLNNKFKDYVFYNSHGQRMIQILVSFIVTAALIVTAFFVLSVSVPIAIILFITAILAFILFLSAIWKAKKLPDWQIKIDSFDASISPQKSRLYEDRGYLIGLVRKAVVITDDHNKYMNQYAIVNFVSQSWVIESLDPRISIVRKGEFYHRCCIGKNESVTFQYKKVDQLKLTINKGGANGSFR
ncbi:MAG: hypothetical protein FWF80_09055 [Defluviitaleaceae bacterium]|nr:hypothetical protein [Defluviitaleaceae bacterium]